MSICNASLRFTNHPEKIVPAVEESVAKLTNQYAEIFLAYADCGSGGKLDEVLQQEGVERLPGPHCYAFFAGQQASDQLHNDELGTFYLTDFLARHFDRLIMRDMGIDKHPELLSVYFANYTRLVYLSQSEDAAILQQAKQAAQRLGLRFEHRHTGYGDLHSGLQTLQPIRVIN